jgi:prepilin peptidase dependent protein B
MLTPRLRQSGMTLVEILVAVAVGFFLLLGVAKFATNTLSASSNTMKMTRLNQDLRAIMALMTRDIRRSGFASDTAAARASVGIGAGAYTNPFAPIDTTTAGCILYSYDRNNDGVLQTTGAGEERYGFLLDSGTVMLRTGGTDFNCTPSGSNVWSAQSDPNTATITALTFVPTSRIVYVSGTSGPNVVVRSIVITLSGQLASDASVRQTLVETVTLQNDQFNAT